MKENFTIFTLSSLEKVFANIKPELIETENRMLQNETFHFQLAMRLDGDVLLYNTISVESDIEKHIVLRKVEVAPCTTPTRPFPDKYLLTDKQTLIPDILQPIDQMGFELRDGFYKSIWVKVSGLSEEHVGVHKIRFTVRSGCGEILGKTEYTLSVLPQKLPKQELLYTDWIHVDSICNAYGVKPFSKKFYEIYVKYLKNAREHGVNMIFVPLFTPPLDTAIGEERMTVQLVRVKKNDGGYTFGFRELKRFLDVCRTNGFEYFEMSHLFTQWGAKAAPKIVELKNGNEIKLFGWHTPSNDPQYRLFLSQFLRSVDKFFVKEGIKDKVYFHTSDEPTPEDIETYKDAYFFLKEHLKGYKIIDAVSNYELYEKHIIEKPVVSTSVISEFLKHKVPNLWAYYCCTEFRNNLSNRFLSMPSQRTRIIGYQLYLNDIEGFLHWGYNYYYTQFSRQFVNPYQINDGGGVFQSGDCFVVYPYKNDIADSIRNEVLSDAIQDVRALKLLEKKIGKERVKKMLREEGLERDFITYPRSAKWQIAFRNRVYSLL